MKSLSNLIKSRYVYLNEIEKKVIDTNDKSEEFRIIHLEQYRAQESNPSYTITREADTNADALLADNEHSMEGNTFAEGKPFTEGLAAALVNSNLREQTQEAALAYEEIIKRANEEAERIIEEGKEEAKRHKEAIYMEAREKGYGDGLIAGEEEVLRAKKEAEEVCEQYRLETEREIAELEPKFAEIISLLVEKITGIITEDRKEVISHLIHRAIQTSYDSKSYLIKVSKEDYEYVRSKKEELIELILGDASLEVIKDNSLGKNQCLIETETSVIDCSLDVQLQRLKEDIRLLSIKTE